MEDLFSCSGWCNTSPVYSFTDVNDGIPGSIACYVEFKDYFSSNGELYGIVGVVIASFLLLSSKDEGTQRKLLSKNAIL